MSRVINGEFVRKVPRELKEQLSTRYHPYLDPPISILEMSAQEKFTARIDAYDNFNHHVHTYIGYLRRYQAKRIHIINLCEDMIALEKDMVTVQKKMEAAGKTIVENLPSHVCNYPKEEDDDTEVALGPEIRPDSPEAIAPPSPEF